MNKVLLSVALALGLCGSGCFSQSTDKNDIRFVDVDRILTQSKTARVRDSHIEAVNQSLKADLEKLMQAMARAPEAERRRADQMGISVMDRVLAKETAAAEKIMRDGIREAVNRYVNKNPGHIIVDRGHVLSAPATAGDITQIIMDDLDSHPVSFPDFSDSALADMSRNVGPTSRSRPGWFRRSRPRPGRSTGRRKSGSTKSTATRNKYCSSGQRRALIKQRSGSRKAAVPAAACQAGPAEDGKRRRMRPRRSPRPVPHARPQIWAI